MKKKLLFVITQFYKGGAETSLLNLFHILDPDRYEVDFMVLNQLEYPDVTSLIGQVPDWIQVYDVLKQSSGISAWQQLKGKVYRRLFHAETYTMAAEKLIKDKQYDAAFSFGEWLSPKFVASRVNAKGKYVWIHIDLDKADFVNKEELLRYDQEIDGYIFVSEQSRKGSVQCCPQMEEKSYLVHNFLNEADILKKAHAPLPEKVNLSAPYLLSVGNLRVEKNYPRQIEVMRILKQRHVPVKWLCVGSTANREIYKIVDELLNQYELKDDFILCGTDDNPYRYMQQAAAVTVLSDHESWSLVISEAKLLGVPVIATRTSGAQEQLIHGKTGLIVDFDPEEIADTIEQFLKNTDTQEQIRRNLQQEQIQGNGLQEFERLLKR